jgi:threonine/homoserine/homoserine lactone efflux protein
VAYIVTRTLTQGRTAGLASVAGVALGNLGNALAASLGLAAVVMAVPWAFDLIKLGGAAYLIALGLASWRAPGRTNVPGMTWQSPRRILRDGFVVALLNPKTALFFAAFLPQFIEPGPSTATRTAWWGALFVAIAACTDTAYVLSAHAVAPSLQGSARTRTLARWATTAVYIVLGLYTALADWRGVH